MAKLEKKEGAAELENSPVLQERKRRGSRKKKCGSALGTVLFVFLALVLMIGLGLLSLSNRMLNQIERVDKSEETWIAPEEAEREMRETEELEREPAEDGTMAERSDTITPEDVAWTRPKEMRQKPRVRNILLIGQDRRPGETRARSDSMILCSINEYTKELTLTSFMRDMYVPYPGEYYPSRMNHAFAWGGMSLLDQLIEEDFGVTIDGNVVVDFDGFVQVMDMIAPLEIDLRDEEAWYMNLGNKSWMLHTGVNALNGEQILSYARLRYVGRSDWERTERQRRVLSLAFDKVKNMSLTELTDLANAALPCMTTDMSNAEIMNCLYTVATNRMQIGETHRLPVEGTYTAEVIYGMDVLVPDLEKNSEYLHRYIYGQM